jgi:tRNA(Leu) C34 or U34 (ribose-2'-O)-methylase TrmL
MSQEIGKKAIPIGKTPAILLSNPKYARNLSMIKRVASCYGVEQVWHTGNRMFYEPSKRKSKPNKERLPREERMKGYSSVQLINFDYVFDQFPNATPVAVEVLECAEPLHLFDFPDNPLFVFGAEDGEIPQVMKKHCHRFLVIPTRHCLNLAVAVGTVLSHWQTQQILKGNLEYTTPGEFEKRGPLVADEFEF